MESSWNQLVHKISVARFTHGQIMGLSLILQTIGFSYTLPSSTYSAHARILLSYCGLNLIIILLSYFKAKFNYYFQE